MRVTVSIDVEFEDADEEKCGESRGVRIVFKKPGWGAVAEAVGMALKNVNTPRDNQTAAIIVDEIIGGYDLESQRLSAKLLKSAKDVIQAYEDLDSRNPNRPIEQVLDEVRKI